MTVLSHSELNAYKGRVRISLRGRRLKGNGIFWRARSARGPFPLGHARASDIPTPFKSELVSCEAARAGVTQCSM